MKEVNLGPLINALSALCSVATTVDNRLRNRMDCSFPRDSFNILDDRLRQFTQELVKLNAPLTLHYAQDAGLAVASGEDDGNGNIVWSGQKHANLAAALTAIANTFGREVGALKFFSVSPSDAELIAPPGPIWGADFVANFPSASFDLDEAAKCRGLGRSTASVFHLMRVVEIGLSAIYLCLGLPPLTKAERSWGAILGRINDEVFRRGKSFTEKDLFREYYALLVAVKDAWRNTTMHVENKYTPEEAESIFLATRGLMKKIAARMDENGRPQA